MSSDDADLIDLDSLSERVGVSVRNIRFYTSRGLVAPPIRRGRQGWYDAEHIERLQLIGELQERGFTLAAIEKYVATSPADSTPSGLDELGLPADVVRQAAEIYRQHGEAIAGELMELFRASVIPAYPDADPDELDALVEQLKPLSIAALISAYESALAARRGLGSPHA